MGNLGNLLSKGNVAAATPNTEQASATAPNSQEAKTNVDTDTNQKPAMSPMDESKYAASSRAIDENFLNPDESGDEDKQAVLIATSAPIQRFKIGRFQFEKAVLTLYNQDDAEEFRKLVVALPPADRNQIRIVDAEAAARMVRPIEPGVTKQFDSSVGRQRETLGTGDKVIGDKPLEGAAAEGQGERFAKVAQMDNNAPVAGRDGNNVVNELNQGDVQSDEQLKDQQAANKALGDKI